MMPQQISGLRLLRSRACPAGIVFTRCLRPVASIARVDLACRASRIQLCLGHASFVSLPQLPVLVPTKALWAATRFSSPQRRMLSGGAVEKLQYETTDSGLQFHDLVVGTGEMPQPGTVVEVRTEQLSCEGGCLVSLFLFTRTLFSS